MIAEKSKAVFESRIPASLRSVFGFIPEGPMPPFEPPSTPVLGFVITGVFPVVPVVPETGVVVPGVVLVLVELHSLTREGCGTMSCSIK